MGKTSNFVPSKKLAFWSSLAKAVGNRKKEIEAAEAERNAQSNSILKAILPTILSQRGAMARTKLTTGLGLKRLGFDVKKETGRLDLEDRKLLQTLGISQAKLESTEKQQGQQAKAKVTAAALAVGEGRTDVIQKATIAETAATKSFERQQQLNTSLIEGRESTALMIRQSVEKVAELDRLARTSAVKLPPGTIQKFGVYNKLLDNITAYSEFMLEHPELGVSVLPLLKSKQGQADSIRKDINVNMNSIGVSPLAGGELEFEETKQVRFLRKDITTVQPVAPINIPTPIGITTADFNAGLAQLRAMPKGEDKNNQVDFEIERLKLDKDAARKFRDYVNAK